MMMMMISLAQLAHSVRLNIDVDSIVSFDDNLNTEDDSDNWENNLIDEFRTLRQADKTSDNECQTDTEDSDHEINS